jgi:hypothetical protein
MKNAIVEGAWTLGVDALSASQKRVLIQYNQFLNLDRAANVIFGGASIEGNVIVGTLGDSGGTGIYWSPTSILGGSYQWVRHNYIHFIGGDGIRVRPHNHFGPWKHPTPPDIHRTFISGPLTVISEKGDRITGASAEGSYAAPMHRVDRAFAFGQCAFTRTSRTFTAIGLGSLSSNCHHIS